MSENHQAPSPARDSLEQAKRRALSDDPPSRESLLCDVPEDQRAELLQFFQELDDLESLVLPDDGSAGL
jgi:hypothetical protein